MKKFGFLFLAIVFPASAAAYTRITTSSGQSPKWPVMPISYSINERGLAQISNGSEFAAVQAGFQTWQDVQTADIRFNYRGKTSLSAVAGDGMNLITFADETTPLGSSTIAATFQFYTSDGGQVVFSDADIAFNPVLPYSTTGEQDKFDIQSIATHEIGHFLGLDHSGLLSSVMEPFGTQSVLDQRTLAYDDMAGASEIYPKAGAASAVGQIRGVIQAGTVNVFGAHVVAVDSNGTPIVSTLSQPDGSYTIRFLPSGIYRVYAEPLDNPVIEGHVGGGATSFYRNLKTDFGTTYSGNVANFSEAATVSVTANVVASANIQTLPRSALNVTRPAFSQRIARGTTETLRIGGEDITQGVSITASNPGISLGVPSFGKIFTTSVAPAGAAMEMFAADSTPLGPKNIDINRSGAGAVASGVVIVTEGRPSNISVAPPSGPMEGGSLVTISGSNFRPGAQVYFGGLAAANVQVVDSGTILASTPENNPTAVTAVVVNSDGTWGIRRQAFTYTAEQPRVTRISPSSGPPTTTVSIEGEHFDSRTQNVEVRFNGVSARVVSSTANVITAIVPFGATSGPVAVSVFGRGAAGPDFTVTGAASSANVAGNAFNFVDASAASGGASLNFISSDDSVASSSLPFNFSLFRDIYLAGSRISISTNGWLSLEPLLSSEFQNTSLPAQTVTRPGGSTGTVPPSMIAPFWDDLILRSGSAVSTRTIGAAPNRQFIVQWSNAGILDEQGKDVNAFLTFEAILFEGSNDIQFVYRTMTGSRADGSSATVGAQDLKRTAAVQSGFNQPVVSSEFFITYRFRDGSYAVETPDVTPPAKPVVTDGGALTPNRTELSASWISTDPESGIRDYQYAIGTTPGGTDVRPFTTTTQSSVVATGLNLQLGITYYFAVKATNRSGVTSETGFSDGIRIEPAFQPEIKIIPAAPASSSEFSGIALLAPAAMSVVLKAYDSAGSLITGTGVRNPTTVNLAGGQQYARLVNEIFGMQNFDGWIESEASGTGLGIFTATGSWDMTQIDGSVAREPSTDFVLFHAGASAVLVNPSPRQANVTLTNFGALGSRTLSIPARNRVVVPLTGIARVQSSEALVSIERSSSSVKSAVNAGVPVSAAASSLVFPHAVVGAGYTSVLTLANVASTPLDVTITCSGSTGTLRLDPNGTTRVSIADLLQLDTRTIRAGAVRVSAQVPIFGGSNASMVGVLDIENSTGLVTVGARPAASEFVFPHVAHGNGLFTGLAFATGDSPANITIEVYEAAGGTPKSRTIALEANQQLGRLVSELVPTVTTQTGGYIRIRSDQPIWSWEIYGSGQVMASGPPL